MNVSPEINPLRRLYDLAAVQGVTLDDNPSFLSITVPIKLFAQPGDAYNLVHFLRGLPGNVLNKLLLRFGQKRVIDFTENESASWFDWETIRTAKFCGACADAFKELEDRYEEVANGLPDPDLEEDSLQLLNVLEQCETCSPQLVLEAGVEKRAAANAFLIDSLLAAGRQLSPLVWFEPSSLTSAFESFQEFLDFIKQQADQPIVMFFDRPIEAYEGRYFKILSLTREGKPANEVANEIEAALGQYDSDVLSAYQMLVTDHKQENRTGLVTRFDVSPALFLRRDGELATYPAHPLFSQGPLRSFLVYSIMAWLAPLRTEEGENVVFTLLSDKKPPLKVVLEFTLTDVLHDKKSIFSGNNWMEIAGRVGRDIEHSAGSEYFRNCWSKAMEDFTLEDFVADRFFETLEKIRQNAEERMREPPVDIRQLTPDLSLYITLDIINKKLVFQLGYLNPRLGLKLERDEKPSTKEDIPIDELDQMAKRNFTIILDKDPQNPVVKVPKLEKLETRGEAIWDDLIPDELKRAFIKLAPEEDLSLFIYSDDRAFPWEMIKPREYKDLSKIVPEGFADDWWGLRFGLGRWSPGAPSPANEITITSVCCVAASSALSSAQQEIDYLDSLKSLGVSVDKPQTMDELIELLKTKDYDVIHFACHGNYESGDPGESVIQLPDGSLLHPDDLRTGNIPAKIGKNRPLFFLNCCHSGRTGNTLVGVAGWAKRFVDWGCGAFIGCGWEVLDPLAAEFAITFYRSFKDENKSLGQAIRQARMHIRERSIKEGRPQNSTWLAYYLYGNPNCYYKG